MCIMTSMLMIFHADFVVYGPAKARVCVTGSAMKENEQRKLKASPSPPVHRCSRYCCDIATLLHPWAFVAFRLSVATGST